METASCSCMGRIYLDNNATTHADPQAVEAMLPLLHQHFGNASAAHAGGACAAQAVRAARREVQQLLGGAHEDEIVFTSGGTESDNAALLSALETQAPRDEIVTTSVEHPAVLALCRHLGSSRGIRIHVVPVDGRGRLDLEAFRRALSPRTAIASAMWANNETGTLFPVAALAELAHEAGALFHTDAVQAVGRVPIALAQTQIDLLSLSGHKLHGPPGVGALYVRRGVRFSPLLRGGKQERGRRAGTENAPAIAGLGKAAQLARTRLASDAERMQAQRDRFERGLLARIAGAQVNGEVESRLPNTSNVSFAGVDAEALLARLDRAGLAASAGSACSSGATEPSHVLRAMGLPYARAMGAVRFSLSRETTDAELLIALELVARAVEEERACGALQAAGDAA